MKLEFQPQIYRVGTYSGANYCSWDLLTLDGENPKETIYFLHKDDAPSHEQQNEIVKAIEKKDWDRLNISEEDVLLNYDIDITIFDNSDAYSNIVDTLNQLSYNFLKKTIKMEKAEKIYIEVFNNLPSYSSDTYAEGTNGSVTINNERITILDSEDNYIIRDIHFGTLKNIVNQLN